MMFKVFSLVLLAVVPSAPAAAQLLYADVKTIIDDNCVVCHTTGGAMDGLPFETLAQIKGNQDRMAKAIKEGVMPFGNPDFADTADGKKLITWLETGTDLKDPPPTAPRLIDRDPRTLRFADLEPVLKSRCQICHAPGRQMARIPLISLDNLRRRAKQAWNRLDDAEMPPGDPDFAFSADGRALAGWLRYGEDVSWRLPNPGGDDDPIPVDDD
jgi:uncharacterized membrane protein